MRRLLALFLVLITALALSVQTAMASGVTVLVDGETLLMDKGFLVTEQAVMAPAGVIAKALGGTVTWNGAEGTGVLEAAGKKIELADGKASATVNGHPVQMEAPVQVKDGEVYLPATFLVLQFGGRLKIDHPALKDARALQLLAKALQPAGPDLDVHSEMQMRLEEQGLFWVNLNVTADSQVRGKDSLTTVKVEGPIILKDQQAIAVKDGKVWVKTGDTWEEDLYGHDQGIMGEFGPLMPLPAPDQAEMASQMLMALVVKASVGEQRTEGSANVQDVHLVLDLGSLMAPAMGMGRRPDGSPAMEPDPDVPQFIIEQATATITVDLATGRALSQRVDVIITIAGPVPTMSGPSETIPVAVRLEVHAKASTTPNATPIAWPEALSK